MATKTAPTKTTRIPRFDGDERTFLAIDENGELAYGPTLYGYCHQWLRGADWKGAIVHKSDPGRALPVPKTRDEWNELKPLWEALVNGGMSN